MLLQSYFVPKKKQKKKPFQLIGDNRECVMEQIIQSVQTK